VMVSHENQQHNRWYNTGPLIPFWNGSL
jgi:hypothetical protein